MKANLIDSVGNMYLIVDSLIEINNIITDSNNMTLIKINLKSFGFDKMCMDKYLIDDRSGQWNKNYWCKVLFNTSKYINFMMEIVEWVRCTLLIMLKKETYWCDEN